MENTSGKINNINATLIPAALDVVVPAILAK
jgi:hypothetical protein